MKRNLHHGSGIIHPNYDSNEQILYTIPVIVCGDVQTKDSVSVINRNAFDMEDSVNGAPKLNSANINQLQYNNQHSKARRPVKYNGIPNKPGYNSCKLPFHLPNLQKQMKEPKKLHDTDMNLNYTIPVIVNGQVSSSKSEKMSAISDEETDNCDSTSAVNRFSSKSSLMKGHKVLIIGDSHARNCAANVKTVIRDNFDVRELVKSSAGTDILVNSANNAIMSL